MKDKERQRIKVVEEERKDKRGELKRKGIWRIRKRKEKFKKKRYERTRGKEKLEIKEKGKKRNGGRG